MGEVVHSSDAKRNAENMANPPSPLGNKILRGF